METIDVKSIDVSIVKDADKEAQSLTQQASGLAITTAADCEAAGSLRQQIKGRIKFFDEKRKSITAPLDLAKKNIMALFTPVIERLENAVEILDQGVIVYTEEQEKKARELQAKVDEEARKAREKAELKAKELEAQGKHEKAAVMQEKADTTVAPVITAPQVKVAGQSIKEMWYAEVTDFNLLANDYKLPNQSALDKIAQATKGQLKIPGVRFYSKKIVSGRAV